MIDMSYPLVNVKTRDGLLLHGLLTEPVKPAKTIDIHIHVSAQTYLHCFTDHSANALALPLMK
jgi:hypothetical protein